MRTFTINASIVDLIRLERYNMKLWCCVRQTEERAYWNTNARKTSDQVIAEPRELMKWILDHPNILQNGTKGRINVHEKRSIPWQAFEQEEP